MSFVKTAWGNIRVPPRLGHSKSYHTVREARWLLNIMIIKKSDFLIGLFISGHDTGQEAEAPSYATPSMRERNKAQCLKQRQFERALRLK
jgi:hypothetical protein